MRVAKQVILKFGILNCLLLFSNCAVNKEDKIANQYAYGILNKLSYRGVNKITLGFSDIFFNENFNINAIDKYNVKDNWVLEDPPHIDFDTIFNSNQKIELNNKLKNLNAVKLKNSLLDYNTVDSSKSIVSLSFPVIQEGLNGMIYGFVYEETSVEAQILIFRKEIDDWVLIGKVPMGIS